jgi:two-component system, cell cycle response regulator DivK
VGIIALALSLDRSTTTPSTIRPCTNAARQTVTGRSRFVNRILYVEDNEDNVYMLKMRLELTDEFEVLVAEDGEKGCAMAASERPDLILMDLEMPVIDGWEATRRIKSKPETRGIPVIGLSAHALAGERDKALAAGCEDFDTKPVELDRLLAKMRRLLGAAQK